jgi:hypothetical protein
VKRAVALLAITGVFLAGIFAGVCGVHLYYLHRLREPGGMVGWGTRLLARDLKSDLDLTPVQERQVDAILLETRTEALAVRRKITPEMKAILERSRHRIEAVLNAEQKEKFERLRERRLSRFRRWWIGAR